MDGFDSDQIARAIALSLQEAASHTVASKRPTPAEVIEVDSDDDDESLVEDVGFQVELQRAMKLSNTDSGPRIVTSSHTQLIPPKSDHGIPLAEQTDNPLLLDRKKLEEERLARQKRLRPEIQHASMTAADEGEDEGEGEEQIRERNSKRQCLSPSLLSSRRANASSSSNRTVANIARPSAASSVGEGLFWDGELRQIANKYVDQDKDVRSVFRLSEIIGPKDDISFAILSAYVVDQTWIYGFFERRTPVILIAQDPHGNETMKEILPEWIRTTPRLPGGRGCMHMKFMLIFYRSGRLRVVVSTANLIQYDWRDIENTAWVQDFPLRPTPIAHDSKATDFPATLARILRSVNVVPALLNMTRNGHDALPIKRVEEVRCKWDFSKAKVFLVPSLAGRHEGWPKVIETGHTALMKAVRDMGARTGKERDLMLECQGSSIGTYTTQWTNEFHCSARGESAEGWLDQPRSRRMKLPYPLLKIVFPTTKTVQDSVLGEPGGGTIFCRKAQWEAAKFPRELFYDSNSKRGRILMHSKMIIGTFTDLAITALSSRSSGKQKARAGYDSVTDPDSDEDIVEVAPHPKDDVIAWAYVGSHNFTPSAWGNLSGSAFNPIMNVTNYELGIVFPLRSERQLEEVACWQRPARKYVTGRDVPWMQSESAFFAA